MPRVPTLDAPTVAPGLGPQNQFRSTLSEGAATVAGRQLQQSGQALERAGSQFGDIYLRQQEDANRLRATEAANQAKAAAQRLTYDKDVGYVRAKGGAAVYRDSGKALPDEYTEKLDEELGKLGDSLTNPQQREMFGETATALRSSFRENASQHFLREYTAYGKSVNEGTIAVSTEAIALNPYDNTSVERERLALKAAAYELGQASGLGADAIEMTTKQFLSKAQKSALMQALDREELTFAKSYFEKYRDDLTADDLRDVEAALGAQDQLGLGYAAVDAAFSAEVIAPAATPQDPALVGKKWRSEEVTTALKPQLPAGYTITSGQRDPNSYLGRKNPGSAHNHGRALDITAPNEKTGRDPAAFNAMVERLRSLGLNVKGKNEYTHPAAWATGPHWHFQWDDTPATGSQQTQRGAQAMDQQSAIKRAIDAAQQINGGPISPKERQTVEQLASQRWQREKADTATADDARTKAAMEAIVANGGNVSALLPSVLAAVPADKVPAVMDLARNIRETLRENNPNLPVIMFDLTSDPKKLRDMTDSAFFALSGQIPTSQFQQLTEQRAALRNPSQSAETKATLVPVERVNRVLNAALSRMDIDPSPKGKDAKTRVGSIQMTINDIVLRLQKKQNAQVDDEQITEIVDRALATPYQFDTTFAGQRTGTKTMPLFGMRPQDVPSFERSRISDYLQTRVGKKPTEEEVYFQFLQEQTGLLPKAVPKKQ